MNSSKVARSQLATVAGGRARTDAVGGMYIASAPPACHRRRRQRPHRRGARDVHRERDLAEVVAGPQDAPRAERRLAYREHPAQHHVEALAAVALADDRLARRDLLAAHAGGELRQLLSR